MNLEWGEVNGKCRQCDTATLLVTPACWHTDSEDGDEDVEPEGEVSGHYCPHCNRLTAVFLNGQHLEGER